jgi:hypothetical protein
LINSLFNLDDIKDAMEAIGGMSWRETECTSCCFRRFTMAHDVTFTITKRPVEKKDIIFDVKKNRAVVGKLHVSQGGVEWVAKNGGQRNTHSFNWQERLSIGCMAG